MFISYLLELRTFCIYYTCMYFDQKPRDQTNSPINQRLHNIHNRNNIFPRARATTSRRSYSINQKVNYADACPAPPDNNHSARSCARVRCWRWCTQCTSRPGRACSVIQLISAARVVARLRWFVLNETPQMSVNR